MRDLEKHRMKGMYPAKTKLYLEKRGEKRRIAEDIKRGIAGYKRINVQEQGDQKVIVQAANDNPNEIIFEVKMKCSNSEKTTGMRNLTFRKTNTMRNLTLEETTLLQSQAAPPNLTLRSLILEKSTGLNHLKIILKTTTKQKTKKIFLFSGRRSAHRC
jgi:hypothetical protein